MKRKVKYIILCICTVICMMFMSSCCTYHDYYGHPYPMQGVYRPAPSPWQYNHHIKRAPAPPVHHNHSRPPRRHR